MSLTIERYEDEHVDRVRAFNARLAAGGSRWRFPESSSCPWLPPREGVPLWQEMYLAIDGTEVRGAYLVKPQTFWAGDREIVAAHIQLPLSEAIVDRRYALIGARLLRHAVSRHPLLFSLGLGSLDTAAARLLATMKFEFVRSRFFFRVLKPNRFLREIRALRTTPSRRRALNAAAASGIGWLGLSGLDSLTRPPWRRVRGRDTPDRFGEGADLLWRSSRHAYALAGTRSAAALNAQYPPGDPRFTRVRTTKSGRVVGWSVVSATRMNDHRQFGDMRVGTVVDCMSLPGFEREVVLDAEAWLARQDVDLIVSNQLHRAWRKAFGASGYLRGPSNVYFGTAPSLTAILGSIRTAADRIHMTRGDGDGPVHLVPGFALTELVSSATPQARLATSEANVSEPVAP